MTRAILLPSGDATAYTLADGEPLGERLTGQLRRAGAREVVAPADLAEVAQLAETSHEPLILCAGDVVTHDAVLRHLATNPVNGTVALFLPDVAPAPGQAAIREERGQIVAAVPAAAPADSSPGGAFGGAVRVAIGDLPALAAAARGADESGPAPVAVGASSGPASVAAASGPATRLVTPALDRLLAALTAAGTTIATQRVRLLVARRVTDQQSVAAAAEAVAAVDPDRAQLRLAVKERDDLFSTYAVSSWSPYVTKLAARLGLSPTAVTAVSVVFAFAAAALFGLGHGRWPLVLGAVLLYLGFVLDCVDGQLARYTRQFSAWGGWLDTIADRAKEYVVYAGLAIGVERAGLGNGWGLAIAAITLQTVRHMTDTWYGVLHDQAARRPKPAGTAGLGDRLSRASVRVQADTGSLSYWLKRTVVFPIGERWALIALTVALFNPLVSLVAVLTWGSLAFVYTFSLRTLRARSMRVPVLSGVDTALHRDDGPVVRLVARLAWGRRLPGPLPLALLAVLAAATLLAAGLSRAYEASAATGAVGWTLAVALVMVLAAGARAAVAHDGASDWLLPAALRAAEYVFVIAVGVWWAVPAPLVFGLLLVLALHHYDLTARLEKRAAPPALHVATLGWDGRVVIVAVEAAAGLAAGCFVLLSAYLLVIFVLSAVLSWRATALRNRTKTESDIAYSGG